MNIKKKAAAVALAICLVLGLAACGEQQEEVNENAVVMTDMIGRELEIEPGSYEKVVCIGAGALRIYSYIGDISLLCGVEDIDNLSLSERPKMFDSSPRPYVLAYGKDFEALPSCGTGGPNAQAAEAEKILSCGPDIVISMYADADKANALQEQLGVPVVTLVSGPEGVFAEDFIASLKLLGDIFCRQERAQELISFIESETEDIHERTKYLLEEQKPSVYICGLGNWGTTNHLSTAETYKPFEVANIKNAVSGLGIKKIGEIEEEKFVSLGAETDLMFIDAAAVKNIAPLYAQNDSLFDSCKAWMDREVYLEMAYNSYYTNYEIALANTWFIAKTVYPAQHEDIDVYEKLGEITKAFLGKDLAAEICACPASFGGYGKIDTAEFFK